MKRNHSLDILKGIAIIIVVALHASIPFKWLHLFQMSVFFTASGFCYRSKASETFSSAKQYVWKRIKGLYFPCVIFSATITVLHNPFVAWHIVGGSAYNTKQFFVRILKCICFSGGEDLSGTIWFLRTMFIASILYLLIDMLTRKSKHALVSRWIICVVALFGGWLADHFAVPGHEYFNALTVLFMYELGRTSRELDIRPMYPGHQKPFKIPVNLLITVLCGVSLRALNMVFDYSVTKNRIPRLLDLGGLVICSVLGWILLTAVSELLHLTPLKGALSYLGKHTLIVMLLHFLCFKLVTAAQILIYQESWDNLAAFPCLHMENGWWIAYTAVGVLVPILLYIPYSRVKALCLKTRRQ